MKLKFKPSRRQIAVLAVVAVAFAGLLAHRSTGATGGLDADAKRACADLAAGYRHARTTVERLRLADKVMVSSQQTRNDEIQARAAEMGRSADDSTTVWRTRAVALGKACRDAGWSPQSVS